MRYDRVFVTVGEDGFLQNYYLRFVAYFLFALCLLPCYVSEKDGDDCKLNSIFIFVIFLSAVTCAHLMVDGSI